MRQTGLWLLILLMLWSAPAAAQYYSRPVETAPQAEDIGKEYVLPEVQRPAGRAEWLETLDVVVLAIMLLVVARIVLGHRSRRETVLATIFSVLYFGFYREGCICPIGAIQNVAVALTDPHYAIPYTVIAIFFLPLAVALVFGRVFCGGVCALGAIQDLVVVKPIHLPRWVDKTLGLFKYVYLGLAIWFAIQPRVPRDTLLFPPGTTTRTITVPVIGDDEFEPDEVFTVRLANPVHAVVTDSEGQATIRNDDPKPEGLVKETASEEEAESSSVYITGDDQEIPESEAAPEEPPPDQVAVRINDAEVAEGDTGKTNLVLTVSLSEASTQPIRVDYAIVSGTATENADYAVRVRDFIICRFDPFVGFFRLTGSGPILIAGGVLLLIGLFIGRPYCRFLCPYGGLLAWLSRFAWRGVTITPDEELDCGLCARACPFGAIEKMRAVRSSCLSCSRCYQSCPKEQARRGEIGLVEIANSSASSRMPAESPS